MILKQLHEIEGKTNHIIEVYKFLTGNMKIQELEHTEHYKPGITECGYGKSAWAVFKMEKHIETLHREERI